MIKLLRSCFFGIAKSPLKFNLLISNHAFILMLFDVSVIFLFPVDFSVIYLTMTSEICMWIIKFIYEILVSLFSKFTVWDLYSFFACIWFLIWEYTFLTCGMTCAYDILYFYSQIVLRSKVLRHHFYFLPKVIIQVQNDNGLLNRVVSCL